MKKREQEELISKSVIFTIIFLAIMFFTMLVQKGYFKINFSYFVMPKLTLGISIGFLVTSIVFVVLGFRKKQKFFEVSAWTAGLATFTMLLKINYEIKALEFKLPSNFFVLPNTTIKFYAVSMLVLTLAIGVLWIRTIVKLIKK